jgi:hypothetical protein
MWVNDYNPSKGDWYLCIVDGKKQPLMYNEYNIFWCALSGKVYKPNQVEWLDDSKIKTN